MPGSSSGQLATSAMHHPLMDPKERRRECFAELLAESTPQGKSQAMVLCRCDGFSSPDPVLLVQSSFHQIATRLNAFGKRFYAILFDRYPELRPLFKNDIALQTHMLTSMLSSLVKGLNRAAEISGGLRALGKRHCGYQATLADYEKVANALLLTLEEFLGDDFNPEIRDAWISVFGTISGLMIEGTEGRCDAGMRVSECIGE